MGFRNSSLRLAFIIATLFSAASLSQAAPASGDWVKVPDKWLLNRFVRPSTTPAMTFHVAVVVPPGANPKSGAAIAKSSGDKDVDLLAADYVRDTAVHTKQLSELGKTKELYFQLIITPPALDINLRSEAGRRPVPPDQDPYTPQGKAIYLENREAGEQGKTGELAVVFPAGGGHALYAIADRSTGNSGVDRYYVHNAALNWQTAKKASSPQGYRMPFGVQRAMRWESLGQ